MAPPRNGVGEISLRLFCLPAGVGRAGLALDFGMVMRIRGFTGADNDAETDSEDDMVIVHQCEEVT